MAVQTHVSPPSGREMEIVFIKKKYFFAFVTARELS